MSSRKAKVEVEVGTKKPALQVALGIQVVSARALGNLLSSTMDEELGREKPDMKLLSQLSNALGRAAVGAENLADAAS